jgi:hypothetical protein
MDAKAKVASVETPASAPDATAAPRPARVNRASEVRAMKVSVAAPELHHRLKPVFSSGTNVEKASSGFRDAAQFATIAYAARNTEIPFVLLKHRVLNEGKSLAEAIRMSKPEANTTIEVNRARAQAEAELWSVGG